MAKEILVANSDKAEQEEFKIIFEATDYNLVFSESGEQALLRIKLFKPNLVIVGASLQEKNGLEVLKAIKADPESKHIPVILLSNIFKKISEKERKNIRADGIINQPFHEDEILNIVDRLIEEEEMRTGKEGIVGREMEWKSIADIGENDSNKDEKEILLDEVEAMEDEEIIDLVDVVEEPERKMSIQDFVSSGKEEPVTGITPLESWEKLIEEEKPADRRFKFAPDEKEKEAKGLPLQLDEGFFTKEEASEKELFDKIELEEILQKVEQLAPSIEQEWPPEERKRISDDRRKTPEPVEPVAPAIEEPPEKYAGLAEFEAALKRGVSAESLEEESPPFLVEKPKKEIPEGFVITEASLEKDLQEIQEENFPESLLEELQEEKVGVVGGLKKEEVEIFEEIELPEVQEEEIEIVEEPKKEEAEIFEKLELPEVQEEKVGVIGEPKKEWAEIFKELEIPEVQEEEIEIIEEPEKEGIEGFEEIELPEAQEEEIGVIGKPEEEITERFEEVGTSEVLEEEIGVIMEPEEERIEIFEEVETPEISKEEVRAFRKPIGERVGVFEEVTTPEVTAPIGYREEIIPSAREVEKQKMEELISKGAREMMEGFIIKLVPEMTQSIINLTLERIERMVKEIVPDLAEKLIQEEIKRLQKGEKD